MSVRDVRELLTQDVRREEKLPRWAQELIGDLRREVWQGQRRAEELDRLRELQEGKAEAAGEGTAFVDEVSDQTVPIGVSPLVMFGSKLTVTWQPHAGRIEVEGDSLVIYPGEYPGIIYVGSEEG